MALFQNSVLKKYLAAQEQAPIYAAFGAYLSYFHDPLRRAVIYWSKAGTWYKFPKTSYIIKGSSKSLIEIKRLI